MVAGTYLLIFISGFLLVPIAHRAVHKGKPTLVTRLLGVSHFVEGHRVHHAYFLKDKDSHSWARRYQSFYSFIFKAMPIRYKIGRKEVLLDLVCMAFLVYVFGGYYVALHLSVLFHWELYEYISHYALPELTDNRFLHSWNAIVPKFIRYISLDIGMHAQHHCGSKKLMFVVLYGMRYHQFYLPLIPRKFFVFMEERIKLNKDRGIL